MLGELIIWRPVMAKVCTLEGVLSGEVTLEHLLKLNALLDAQAFEEAAANESDD